MRGGCSRSAAAGEVQVDTMQAGLEIEARFVLTMNDGGYLSNSILPIAYLAHNHLLLQ